MAKIRWFFKQHEYMIFSIAVLLLVAIWVIDFHVENADVLKPQSLMKIAMGVVAVSIMGGCAWAWMDVVPYYKRKINPDVKQENFETKKLTQWQQTLLVLAERFLAFLWYALFFAAGIKAMEIF